VSAQTRNLHAYKYQFKLSACRDFLQAHHKLLKLCQDPFQTLTPHFSPSCGLARRIELSNQACHRLYRSGADFARFFFLFCPPRRLFVVLPATSGHKRQHETEDFQLQEFKSIPRLPANRTRHSTDFAYFVSDVSSRFTSVQALT
jgi:hypothetical protein